MSTKNIHLRKIAASAVFPLLFALILFAQTQPCGAQTQPDSQTRLASLHEPAPVASDAGTANNGSAGSARPAPEPDLSPAAMAQELSELKARIEQLEALLKARTASESAPTAVPAKATASATAVPETKVPDATPASVATSAPAAVKAQAESAPASTPAKKQKIAPFSDWDWTWLNGNPRNKDVAFDTPFFTPEIRADVTYAYDFNRPQDNSMGGSTEVFRSNEVQLEQLGVGGDFHYDNVRARLMTQFGMYSETTPRNDPSPAKGQWDLDTAYRYLAEAYGGYHLNVLDGINIDAGIFMSYIGLFSYYNYDNWAYQPSYVSSNTPWFFNGVRVQIFPNPHLKIEPWFINGWQSYGSANSRKGLGGQIKWTPAPWVNIISNNYGLGHDDLYTPNRARIHTDDSIEIKYFDRPGKTLDKMAFTFTGDMGCEFGPTQTTSTGVYVQGVGCHGNRRDAKSVGGDFFPAGINPKQSFIGFMLYNRMWFKKDKFAITVGGGQINNPGRYLVLIPPINGATAPSAAINAPYFPGNPSDPFKAWDSSFTFDYMPRQWLTFRWEYDYRHANVPYWTGAGGITPPPGTNNGFPQFYACSNGASSGQATLSAAEAACGSPGSTSNVWFPDLRRDEHFVDFDILVKF
jgi:hypothetical protein